MEEDFSVTLMVLNLCCAAKLLKNIYDIVAEFDDMTVVDPEIWDNVDSILDSLRPLQLYGTSKDQAEQILKRIMMASTGERDE